MGLFLRLGFGGLGFAGLLFVSLSLAGLPAAYAREIKVATFNVSMEATNYVSNDAAQVSNRVLMAQLAHGGNQQIRNIAEIIQRVRPDILLLNEFDYIADVEKGIGAFLKHYLQVSQNGAAAIDYPHYYLSTVNTGKPSPFDFDHDGVASGTRGDAYGFGFFPGHYAMVLLSRFPIKSQAVRTFQHFLWKDMPGALRPVNPQNKKSWYTEKEWEQLPLSSKSHWDIPVEVGELTLHILASHPTPPVFDGPEDRNGARNHDEIRFWRDYLSPQDGAYIYDDKGVKGGLMMPARFVILGDLNAAVDEGSAKRSGIGGLLTHPAVDSRLVPMRVPIRVPRSGGGRERRPKNPRAITHTASWGLRADYVLPSKFGMQVISAGVFWPRRGDPYARLVKSRQSSSDHRLVWSTLRLLPKR